VVLAKEGFPRPIRAGMDNACRPLKLYFLWLLGGGEGGAHFF
jgi:hypothetical protein